MTDSRWDAAATSALSAASVRAHAVAAAVAAAQDARTPPLPAGADAPALPERPPADPVQSDGQRPSAAPTAAAAIEPTSTEPTSTEPMSSPASAARHAAGRRRAPDGARPPKGSRQDRHRPHHQDRPISRRKQRRDERRRQGVPMREIFRRFWPFTATRRGWLVLALLLALAGPAVTTAGIYLLKIVVDDVLIPGRFDLFGWIALAYLSLSVVENLLGGADRILSTWLSQRFLVDLRLHLLRHLQSLSPEFFSRSRLGDVLARLSGDVSAIEGFIVSGTTDFASLVLQLFFFVAALFFLQWQLALVSIVVCPLFWVVARYFSRRIKAISRERQKRSGAIASVAEQVLSNIALVQAYGRTDHETGRFHQEVEGKYRAEMRAARLRAVYAPAIDLIELAGLLAVLGTGAWLISRDQFTVGGLLAFLAYLSQLYSPVKGLGSLLNSAYSASAGAERVLEVLDEQPGVSDRPDAQEVGRLQGRVELERVGFRYPGRTSPALDDLSLTAGPGDVVALVGASGAGKSTVVKLLLRFYDPSSGCIRVDGHDVRDLTLSSLRSNIAVLLQETLVLDGTVRDNIAYGVPEATDADVERAARAADAHDFITALPDGYDARVGERGRTLSGGQCQRLAIARAMLRNAPVLILDEPTTGLDAGSTDRILEPLRRLMAGRTTIIVSHNLATVREATQILVLDHGQVVERGTHSELLRHGGQYRELWRLAGLAQQQRDGARILRANFATATATATAADVGRVEPSAQPVPTPLSTALPQPPPGPSTAPSIAPSTEPSTAPSTEPPTEQPPVEPTPLRSAR